MILFEFKNYDRTEIGHEEVNQTRSYLTQPMGQLGVMVCAKLPNDGAHRQRNTIYTNDRKVILFMTKEHLKEMLFMRERETKIHQIWLWISLKSFTYNTNEQTVAADLAFGSQNCGRKWDTDSLPITPLGVSYSGAKQLSRTSMWRKMGIPSLRWVEGRGKRRHSATVD